MRFNVNILFIKYSLGPFFFIVFLVYSHVDFMFNKYFWSTRNSVPVCQALGPRIYFTNSYY